MRVSGSSSSLSGTSRRLRIRALTLALHPTLLAGSLAINVVSLALPLVLLHVYDRIVPTAGYATLATLLIGLAGALVLDAALRIARAGLAGWAGAVFEHRLGCEAVGRVLGADRAALHGTSLGQRLDRLAAIDQVRDFYAVQGATVLVDLPFAALFLAAIWVVAGPLVWVPLGLLGAFMLAAVS
jgi:ATP-binding cassette subfamily C protein LapB